MMYICSSGGIGRHAGFRNQCYMREGSSPSESTFINMISLSTHYSE